MSDSKNVTELVVSHVCEMVNGTVNRALTELKNGDQPDDRKVNPFTGQPNPPTVRTRVHDRLQAAGLLDDPAFCDDLAELVSSSVQLGAFNMLVWHDGGWIPADATQIEIRIKDGDACEGHMHELIGQYINKLKWDEID